MHNCLHLVSLLGTLLYLLGTHNMQQLELLTRFSNTKQVVSMATRTRLIAGLASLLLHTEMGFWLLQNNETTNVIRLGTCQCGKTTPLHKSDGLLE